MKLNENKLNENIMLGEVQAVYSFNRHTYLYDFAHGVKMTQERRKSNRMNIDVKIKLSLLRNIDMKSNLKTEAFDVEVVNLSKDGLAFRSAEKLQLNTYYDTTVLLWTKEKFHTIIEIVRMENYGEEQTLYGCRFIGIMPSDQLKIQMYEMVSGIDSHQG